MYVYQILNKINGRMYIGSTNNYLARKYEHFGLLRNKKHHNSNLQRDFNIYGESAFVFEILHNDINDRTKLLLKEYDLILRNKGKCYNVHTDCPVFDPQKKVDWSIYKKPFKAPKNTKAKAKKKKYYAKEALKKSVAKGITKIEVNIPPFRRKNKYTE